MPDNQTLAYHEIEEQAQTLRENIRRVQSEIGSLRSRGRRRGGSGLPQQSLMAEPRRIPPHDLAAERAVLGGILIDNTALDRVNLAPEDFLCGTRWRAGWSASMPSITCCWRASRSVRPIST